MHLDHIGAAGQGGQAGKRAAAVIGQANRAAMSIAQFINHVQTNRVQGRGIARGALKKRQIDTQGTDAGGAVGDLGPAAHPRGEQYWPPRRRHGCHQIHGFIFTRADLPGRMAQFVQQFHRRDGKCGTEENQFFLGCMFRQSSPLLGCEFHTVPIIIAGGVLL